MIYREIMRQEVNYIFKEVRKTKEDLKLKGKVRL